MKVTYPNGVKETRGYDSLTRMTNLVYKKWLTTLLSIDYRHDNGDRRTNEVWSTGRSLAYGYDRAHQLTDVTSPSRASDQAVYRYDKAGNPICRTEMGFGVTNSFNNLNQIVSGVWTGGAITVAGAVNYAAGTVTVAGVTGAIYPDSTFDVTNVTVTAGTNILTAVYHGPAFTNTQMVATDQVTVVVGNAAYTHDANGNLSDDQNFTYQYDLANRLTNVILKASNVSVFAASYDGLGRRIQVVRNGTTTERYVYLPGSFLVLAILDGSNAVKEFYTHGPDLSGAVGGAGGIGGILAVKYPQETNAPTYYLNPDAMGHVVLATDQQGKEAGQYQYSMYGRLLNQTGTFTPRFLYASKEFDPESGLINFGYRHLNPQFGQWMERDRILERGGVNLYRSFSSNPVRYIDALGLFYTGPGGPMGDDPSLFPPPAGPGLGDQLSGYPPNVNYAPYFGWRFPHKSEEQLANAGAAVDSALKQHCGNIIHMPRSVDGATIYQHEFVPPNAMHNTAPPTEHPLDHPMNGWETHVTLGRHWYTLGNITVDGPHLRLKGLCWRWTGMLRVTDRPGVTTGDRIRFLRHFGVPDNSPPVVIAQWSLSGEVCCCTER